MDADEDYKELFTINTHKCLFRYNHLSFGVRSAPAMLTGFTGAAAFIVVIVARAVHDELLKRLFSVFGRIQQNRFSFLFFFLRLLMPTANGHKFSSMTRIAYVETILKLKQILNRFGVPEKR